MKILWPICDQSRRHSGVFWGIRKQGIALMGLDFKGFPIGLIGVQIPYPPGTTISPQARRAHTTLSGGLTGPTLFQFTQKWVGIPDSDTARKQDWTNTSKKVAQHEARSLSMWGCIFETENQSPTSRGLFSQWVIIVLSSMTKWICTSHETSVDFSGKTSLQKPIHITGIFFAFGKTFFPKALRVKGSGLMNDQGGSNDPNCWKLDSIGMADRDRNCRRNSCGMVYGDHSDLFIQWKKRQRIDSECFSHLKFGC